MIASFKHEERLKSFYLQKGLTASHAEICAREKLEKIASDASELSYETWLLNLFDDFAMQLSLRREDLVVVDFGCGSGELVMVMRSLGITAYGYDIYEEEISLGKQLAKDNGIYEEIMFCDRSLLFSALPSSKIDILVSFSVLEHLDDLAIAEMFEIFQHHVTGFMYHLVPSKYKVIDDHTGLKFLGLFPHAVSRAIVNKSGKHYLLSESCDWDVWYRSLAEFGIIANRRGLEVELVKEDIMYPPLTLVPLIGARSSNIVTSFFLKIYAISILLLTRRSLNLYPYLNMVFKKSR